MAVMLLSLTAISCATHYTRMSDATFSDHTGYRESAVDPTTWIVSFAGNGSTTQETVERYTLYRAAELTNEKGFDYFIILNGAQNTTTNSYSTAGTIYEFTSDTKHSATKTIRMYKGARPEDNPNAYD